jgi:hypothetical protein
MRGIMEATSISEVLRQVGSIPELTLEQTDNALRAIRIWSAALRKQNSLTGVVERPQ